MKLCNTLNYGMIDIDALLIHSNSSSRSFILCERTLSVYHVPKSDRKQIRVKDFAQLSESVCTIRIPDPRRIQSRTASE